MVEVLAGVLLIFLLLVWAGIGLAFLACMGWLVFAVIALVRGRRPRSSYGRQLRAAERGRHRRPRRRGRTPHGITIFIDLLPSGLGKRKP